MNELTRATPDFTCHTPAHMFRGVLDVLIALQAGTTPGLLEERLEGAIWTA